MGCGCGGSKSKPGATADSKTFWNGPRGKVKTAATAAAPKPAAKSK